MHILFLFGQAVTSKDTLGESCCLHCFPQKLPGMENPSFLQQQEYCVCVYAWGHDSFIFLASWHCKAAGVQTKIMHCTQNSWALGSVRLWNQCGWAPCAHLVDNQAIKKLCERVEFPANASLLNSISQKTCRWQKCGRVDKGFIFSRKKICYSTCIRYRVLWLTGWENRQVGQKGSAAVDNTWILLK